MKLEDFIYPQKSYGEVLHSLGIPLDKVKLIPFKDGQTLITDLTGSTKGFITDNVHGGLHVTDLHMNTVGSTHTVGEFTIIRDNHFQQTGILQDNVLDGAYLYDNSGQIDMMSTENLFYGRDYFDGHMHLLGSSNEIINGVTSFSMKESFEFESNFDFSFDTNQFSDYLISFNDPSIATLDMLNSDLWSMEAADLFDLFDLF